VSGSGDAEGAANKKRTELVDRRADAAFLIEKFAVTERKACELAHIARSTFRYRADQQKDAELRKKLTQLAQEQPRYGYRRLQVLLRREGQTVNHKRIFRVYRAAGLSVKRKNRKRLVRTGWLAVAATAPNQQWALDFVHDRLASGRTIRVLTVVDTFTRECLALEVDSCLPSRRVTRALDRVISERGRPASIRLDNGTELTSRHFLAWGIDRRIALAHIQPGKPVQNAFIESFNGRLRDECLNTNWFRNLWEARRKITAWRKEYNDYRPHSSLGYRTPNEFAQTFTESQNLMLRM
jgi:putative transposase